MRVVYPRSASAVTSASPPWAGPTSLRTTRSTSSCWGNPTGQVSTPVNPHAGYNTIRLDKSSPFFAGGIGYVELDNITLS